MRITLIHTTQARIAIHSLTYLGSWGVLACAATKNQVLRCQYMLAILIMRRHRPSLTPSGARLSNRRRFLRMFCSIVSRKYRLPSARSPTRCGAPSGGSATGLSGATVDLYKVLLDDSDALQLLSVAITCVARADIPPATVEHWRCPVQPRCSSQLEAFAASLQGTCSGIRSPGCSYGLLRTHSMPPCGC